MEDKDCDRTPDYLKFEYAWAVQIIRKHFAKGLTGICDKTFLDGRYAEFQRKRDPIYAELLDGMGDEDLAKTFVSYWTIAQTIATRSRFWLEAAIAEVIIHQARQLRRPTTEVYSHAMLGQNFPARRRAISEIKDGELEHLAESSPWRVPVQQRALQTIDLLVGEQERKAPPLRQQVRRRLWSQQDNRLARERDKAQLVKVANTASGPPYDRTPLQCNLLVIEPDMLFGEPQAWAIRFVNPKTIAQHAARKQERVNLLRLYAWLVQERITQSPEAINVYVAELVPRRSEWESQDHYPDYFSAATYWSSDQLWRFIGVPFDVVSIAIREEAQEFRQKLKEGLRTLLPHTG